MGVLYSTKYEVWKYERLTVINKPGSEFRRNENTRPTKVMVYLELT